MNILRLWACVVILSAGLRLMLAGNSATFAQTQAHTNKPFVIDGHRHVGDAVYCLTAPRFNSAPKNASNDVGFRVVLSVP